MAVLLLGAHMSIAGGVSKALERAASVQANAVQVFTKNNRQWSGPPVDAARCGTLADPVARAGDRLRGQPRQLSHQPGQPPGGALGQEPTRPPG